MLASEHDEAIRLASEALPLVERLELEAWRARALNVIGVSRVYLGDAEGLRDLEQSVAVARAANAYEQLPAAYNNLRTAQFHLGRISDFEETFDAHRESAERRGTDLTRRWVLAAEAELRSVLGQWDDALRLANEFFATVAAGAPHYQESTCFDVRARIRLARGDVEGASMDTERALELARQAKDPQVLAPALAARGGVLLAEARHAEASALASELLALGFVGAAHLDDMLIELSWLARDLGREAELLAVLEGAPSVPWVDAARAIASGDFAHASGVLARIGFRPGEAYTRLRTVEFLVQEGRTAEAAAELEQALVFHRSVGAVRYIREGEALLAASA
jgi:tetratricopeptide (TPR) repeat protein